jgi:hypothetical protein
MRLCCHACCAARLQVRGPEALRAFSQHLLQPYQAPPAQQQDGAGSAGGGSNSLVEEMRRQVEEQRNRIQELEAELKAAKGS